MTPEWRCPHCGNQMDLIPLHGEWLLQCPRQDSEEHPLYRYTTTDSTNDTGAKP